MCLDQGNRKLLPLVSAVSCFSVGSQVKGFMFVRLNSPWALTFRYFHFLVLVDETHGISQNQEEKCGVVLEKNDLLFLKKIVLILVMCTCPQNPGEGERSSGALVTVDGEPPGLGAGN